MDDYQRELEDKLNWLLRARGGASSASNKAGPGRS
jgi:hypothetical protein